jgi:site-specific recombinase XerD
MSVLRSGVPIAVIALWLGHEQVSTADIYLHADMSMKERAIERVRQPNTPAGRYRPSDPVLAFLEAL